VNAPAPSRTSWWRPSPRQFAGLVLGLALFGAGEGLVVDARLGNSPWTVFAEGLSKHTPLSVGGATVAISFGVLTLWIPLRTRPGLGTVMNAVLIGVFIDVTLSVVDLSQSAAALRGVEVLAGIALVGVGSGFYLGAALGPGPRDGLMTGLHFRTGRPLFLMRTGVELSAFAIGVVLGGKAGLGTLAFALLVGPAVATALRLSGGLPGDPGPA
jgi:uncharacterized protein